MKHKSAPASRFKPEHLPPVTVCFLFQGIPELLNSDTPSAMANWLLYHGILLFTIVSNKQIISVTAQKDSIGVIVPFSEHSTRKRSTPELEIAAPASTTSRMQGRRGTVEFVPRGGANPWCRELDGTTPNDSDGTGCCCEDYSWSSASRTRLGASPARG